MKATLLLCLLAVAVPSLILAAPQAGAPPPQEFQYNVTVVLPASDNRNQEGKIWIILEGKRGNEPFQHEVCSISSLIAADALSSLLPTT